MSEWNRQQLGMQPMQRPSAPIAQRPGPTSMLEPLPVSFPPHSGGPGAAAEQPRSLSLGNQQAPPQPQRAVSPFAASQVLSIALLWSVVRQLKCCKCSKSR